MAKPALSDLKLHPPYRAFRKTKDGVVGMDTEGLVTGYAFLICDSLQNYKWIRSARDVVEYLTNPAYSRSFNTFWNADYDITVLLKWLGKAFCTALVKSTDRTAVYEGVTFKFIPKHFLSVRVGKVTNTFFDAWQFYHKSLDLAAKTYLGEGKIAVGSKEFHEDAYDNPKILEYCMDDARKCALLTQKLLCDLHDMGFSPNTLASPGTIMEEALVGHVHIPDVTKIPQGALEYAYESYRGGWMECFKKGHFDKLYDYDISSAYPYQVSELVSLDGGEWFYKKGRVKSEEFTLGWVKGTSTVTGDVSPLLYRGDVNYTCRDSWDTTVFEEEARFLAPNKIGSFDIKDGWYFRAAETATKPFKYEMRRLFRQKKQIQNSWLPKSMSVSLYGKFAQKDEDGRTGNLFNPVYASSITARTRLTIAKFALMQPEHLCIITTDGIAFDKALPSDVLGKNMGDLQLKYADEGVVVGTNVYTIKGKDPGGEWRPGRFDWLHLLSKNPELERYPLNYFRYTSLAEGCDYDFEQIGVFKNFPYTFSIHFDHKRCFEDYKTGGDLLKRSYKSISWPVSVVKHRTGLWEMVNG